MLTKLPKEKYKLVYNIKEFDLFPVIASVIYLKQQGNIYVDNVNDPKIVFVIHKCAFSYLYTKDKYIDYKELLNFLYSENSIPQYFHIYNSSQSLVDFSKNQTTINIKHRKRMRMNGNLKDFDIPDMKGFDAKTIAQIDINVLSQFNLSFIEKFWSSQEDFVNQGYGYVIMDKNKPACIWYTLCVVNNNCETDILTMPEYRGKGLATVAGRLLLKSFAEKGIKMDWDVFEDNIPSIKIGERFGYKPYFHYDFLSIFKKS